MVGPAAAAPPSSAAGDMVAPAAAGGGCPGCQGGSWAAALEGRGLQGGLAAIMESYQQVGGGLHGCWEVQKGGMEGLSLCCTRFKKQGCLLLVLLL
jgi:hypothetical protein